MLKRGLVILLFILTISLINISHAYNLDIVKDIGKLNLNLDGWNKLRDNQSCKLKSQEV